MAVRTGAYLVILDGKQHKTLLVLHEEGLIQLLGLEARREVDKLLLGIGGRHLSLGLDFGRDQGRGLGLGLKKARLKGGDIVELHCR